MYLASYNKVFMKRQINFRLLSKIGIKQNTSITWPPTPPAFTSTRQDKGLWWDQGGHYKLVVSNQPRLPTQLPASFLCGWFICSLQQLKRYFDQTFGFKITFFMLRHWGGKLVKRYLARLGCWWVILRKVSRWSDGLKAYKSNYRLAQRSSYRIVAPYIPWRVGRGAHYNVHLLCTSTIPDFVLREVLDKPKKA